MKIQYKCTVWAEIELPDDADIDSILEQLESGSSPDYLCDEYDTKFQYLIETESPIIPDGESTIEVYDSEHKLLWSNKHL